MKQKILELAQSAAPENLLEYVRGAVSKKMLEQQQQAILNCSKCQLGAQTPVRTVPWNNSSPDLMVIADVPYAPQAVAKGIVAGAMDGIDGYTYLKQLWAHYGVDESRILYANAVNCMPRSSSEGISLMRIPRGNECKACKEHLYNTIRLAAPKFILILGSTPLSLFSSATLFEQRAKPDPWLEVFGIPALATHHPQYLYDYADSFTEEMYNQMNQDFLSDIERIAKVLNEKSHDFFNIDEKKGVSA